MFLLECEICGCAKTRAGRPFRSVAELTDHLKSKHPLEADAASKRARIKERHSRKLEEAQRNRTIREQEENTRLRASARIVLTSEEVDEIISEIGSLVGMMEPYYSQGDCADSSSELIAKLEAKITSAVADKRGVA